MNTRFGKIMNLENVIKHNTEFAQALQLLGLQRYVDEIISFKSAYNGLFMEGINTQSTLPKPGTYIETKEKIINELRLLLQSIMVATQPNNDFSKLINEINNLLMEERTQLEKRATRRKNGRRKRKIQN